MTALKYMPAILLMILGIGLLWLAFRPNITENGKAVLIIAGLLCWSVSGVFYRAAVNDKKSSQ